MPANKRIKEGEKTQHPGNRDPTENASNVQYGAKERCQEDSSAVSKDQVVHAGAEALSSKTVVSITCDELTVCRYAQMHSTIHTIGSMFQAEVVIDTKKAKKTKDDVIIDSGGNKSFTRKEI